MERVVTNEANFEVYLMLLSLIDVCERPGRRFYLARDLHIYHTEMVNNKYNR